MKNAAPYLYASQLRFKHFIPTRCKMRYQYNKIRYGNTLNLRFKGHQVRNEIDPWCEANLENKFAIYYDEQFFNCHADRVKFILVWAGDQLQNSNTRTTRC